MLNESATSVRLLANSGVKSFSFSFLAWDTSELRITVLDSAGVAHSQTKDVDYSAALSSAVLPSAGVVTFGVAPHTTYGADAYVVIESRVPYSQTTNLQTGVGYTPESIGLQLDRIVRQVQQIRDLTENTAWLASRGELSEVVGGASGWAMTAP